jgi:UDP:flavonoid glycosyltransferase YjiC (YdhE family)
MITGELVHAAPLVAEKLNLPWASAILCPCTFFSAYDPSVLATAPELIHLRKAGLLVNRAILALSRAMTSPWWRPIRELRRAEGLSRGRNPLFDDKFSPHLVLALFSNQLAQPQPDWPRQTIQPGFAFYDRQPGPDPADETLRHFLAAGEPPIVFTQGSTAVHHPGDFYKVSVKAVRQIGRRAILVGVDPASMPASRDVLALKYAPYSEIFPKAAVVVHQGGSGTTGQAMQAGRPTLFVPFGWDQPDNAARLVRVGSALSLSRQDYTPKRAARALTRLITEPSFQERATSVQTKMQAENGVCSACNAVEEMLSR